MAGGRHARSAPRGQAPPPLPPPLPPTPSAPLFDDLANEPVRIYPQDRGRANASPASLHLPSSARLLQALQAVNSSAVVVGVLGSELSCSAGVYTFINRLIGRVAFVDSSVEDSALGAKPSLLASIQLYYEASQSIVFLLGVAKTDAGFLAGLNVEADDAQDHDFAADLAHFQHEKRKMELLVHSCSHLLFQFNERGKFTTNILKNIRLLASEKQSLLAALSASSGKNNKRNDKSSNSSSHQSGNVLAPGRCVPLVMYVLPARNDIINGPHKQLAATSSVKSRSSTVAFCKSQEAILCGLFRSLRGGIVGTLRTRDAVAPANLSKERRLFHVDPAHCVAVLSYAASSGSSRVERRFESVLSSLSMEFLSMDGEDHFDLDAILQPLEEDDIGYPNAIQHLHRGVELLQNATSSSHTSGKDASGVKMDLPTVAQWLKAFQSLVKTLHRAEAKKKQDRADADRDSVRHQFDHLEIRS